MNDPENRISVIFSEEIEYDVEVEELGLVKRKRKEDTITGITVDELEADLKALLGVFNRLEDVSEKYCIDEARASIGVAKDKEGNIKVGILAPVIGWLVGAEASATFGKTSNELLQVRIRRRV